MEGDKDADRGPVALGGAFRFRTGNGRESSGGSQFIYSSRVSKGQIGEKELCGYRINTA